MVFLKVRGDFKDMMDSRVSVKDAIELSAREIISSEEWSNLKAFGLTVPKDEKNANLCLNRKEVCKDLDFEMKFMG